MIKKMTISEHIKAMGKARAYLDDGIKGLQRHFNNKNLGWSLYFRFDDNGVEYFDAHFSKDGKRWSPPVNVYGIGDDREISLYDEDKKYTADEIKEISDIIKVWQKEKIIIEKEQWRL